MSSTPTLNLAVEAIANFIQFTVVPRCGTSLVVILRDPVSYISPIGTASAICHEHLEVLCVRDCRWEKWNIPHGLEFFTISLLPFTEYRAAVLIFKLGECRSLGRKEKA
jgi:hypothetical protein